MLNPGVDSTVKLAVSWLRRSWLAFNVLGSLAFNVLGSFAFNVLWSCAFRVLGEHFKVLGERFKVLGEHSRCSANIQRAS